MAQPSSGGAGVLAINDGSAAVVELSARVGDYVRFLRLFLQHPANPAATPANIANVSTSLYVGAKIPPAALAGTNSYLNHRPLFVSISPPMAVDNLSTIDWTVAAAPVNVPLFRAHCDVEIPVDFRVEFEQERHFYASVLNSTGVTIYGGIALVIDKKNS